MQTLINVSNRLPVTIDETIKKSSGGLVGAMEGLERQYDFKWLGWAGGVVKGEAIRKRLKEELQNNFNFIPVFLNETDASNYYNGFSNSSLWPLLHYMPTYARYEEGWFDSYLKVNDVFADKILETVKSGDIVWIHDYHLMLLPAMLRERMPELKIGFFLHTPFPSYEIFRCHPNREDLLGGLLGADLIGFHTYGYLRHFRSTILRILGIESEVNYIVHENHNTAIGVYPIGINKEKFLNELQSDEFEKCLNNYREAYKDKKIVLSVERLDYTKGVPRKLEAIERFLAEEDRLDDIAFIFIAVPSRGSVKEYRTLLNTVERKVSKINGRYSTITNVPVHFINKPVDSFSELCALYALADVALVTPLIDGMNLVAKEYLACQQEKNGVLILSEFAGAAQELPHAYIVNPYNINEVAQCLKTALRLTAAEKKKLIQPMRARVLKYDASHWAKAFIEDLCIEISAEDLPVKTRALTLEVVEPLKITQHKAFFLDYDGTLAELKKKPAAAAPNDEIKALFEALERRADVDVYLISGRKREDMDHWFSCYDFSLIAEHGYYYKLRGADEWIIFDTKADLSWKAQVSEIFQLFTGMTPGSFVEEKTSSIVWHYRQSDPEFGSWKAHQLVAELCEILSNLPVEIHHGKKIVEVGSIQVNKGIVMEHFSLLNQYDAVLCAGDDETDESMFRSKVENLITIKVGQSGDTAAQFRITSPKAFRNFLNQVFEHCLPVPPA